MNVKVLTGVMALSLVAVMGVQAAPQAQDGGWNLEVTPYLWMMGIDGDVTVGGREVDVDVGFDDVVDRLDIGGGLLVVAERNRYLAWGQIDYLSLSSDEADVEDRLAPEGVSLDTETVLAEAAAGYRVDGWAEGQTFDLLVGVRYLWIENDLSVRGTGDFKDDNDVIDPIFVVRPRIPLFPTKIDGLVFNPTLAIGGGGDSDLVYELQPQLQYQISETWAARIGYRRVYYKIDNDANNEFDGAFQGAFVGLGITL